MKRDLNWHLLLIAAGFLVYRGHLSYPFQFDSVLYLQENPVFRNPETILSWEYFLRQYFYRGGLFWTFGLNTALGGLEPFGFHLFNLILHIANGLLVYWVLKYACRYFRLPGDENRHRLISGFTALLFLLHPIQTESVIYVISRSELLAGFFYLGGLHLLQRAWDRDRPASPAFRKWMAPTGVLAAVLIGYSIKPTIATLPFMAGLYYFLGRESGSPALIKLRRAAPFLLAGIAIGSTALVYKLVTDPLFLAGSEDAALTVGRKLYFLTQPTVVVFHYLKLLLFPFNLNIDPDILGVQTLLSFRLWAALAILVLWLKLAWRSSCRIYFFFACWYFVILAPSSSFVTLLDLAAEHRVYLASLGILFTLVSGLFHLLDRLPDPGRRMALSAPMILVVVSSMMAGLTMDRSRVWASEVTLWQDAWVKSPNKARPLVNLARANTLSGDIETAIDFYQQSLKMNPFYFQTHYNVGVLYEESQKLDLAMKHFRYAAVLNPTLPDVHLRLGNLYMKQKDFQKADVELRRAAEMNPQLASAFRSLGVLYLYHLNKPRQAVAFFKRSLNLDPMQAEGAKMRQVIQLVEKTPGS